MKAIITVYFSIHLVICSLAQGGIYVQRGTDILPFNTVDEMAPNLLDGDKSPIFSSGSFNVGNWTINRNISVLVQDITINLTQVHILC